MRYSWTTLLRSCFPNCCQKWPKFIDRLRLVGAALLVIAAWSAIFGLPIILLYKLHIPFRLIYTLAAPGCGLVALSITNWANPTKATKRKTVRRKDVRVSWR